MSKVGECVLYVELEFVESKLCQDPYQPLQSLRGRDAVS